MECWINPTSVSQGYLFEMAQSNTGGFSYLTFYISSGQVGSAVRPSTSGTEYYNAAGTIIAGVWQHVAVVNTAGTAQLYVNGFAVGATYSMPALSTTPVYCAIGQRANGYSPSGTYYNGYISNLRITTSAVYTGNFTPPTGQLSAIANTKLLTCAYPTFVDGSTNAYSLTASSATVNTANPFPTSATPNPALGVAGNGIYTLSQYAALKTANLWPALDPYYENVTLNLHGNAGTVLPFNTDASTNNFQVTQAGDTKPSNLTPFIENGYWSTAFNGSSSFLSMTGSSATNFSGVDWTVETWVNVAATPSGNYTFIIQARTGTNNWIPYLGIAVNTGLTVTAAINAVLYTSSQTITLGTWNHLALVRSSGVVKLYINGVASSISVTSDINNSNLSFWFGKLDNSPGGGDTFLYLNGYMSNTRFVKGTAVYTSNFTVPTSPLTAITNTTLLINQSSRFIDNSTSAFTITPSGGAAVNPRQPFTAPTGTSAYGSGYFDGTGDYLSVASNTVFDVSGGQEFTVEFWWYPESLAPTYQEVVTKGAGLQIYSTSSVLWMALSANNSGSYFVNTSVGTLTANAWQHIALVRSGNIYYGFLNGVRTTLVTTASSIVTGTDPFLIGVYSGVQYPTNGYVSNVRFVKGTAVYTSAFTPPTSPLTAITNTSLLTVQTNAPSQNNTFLDSSTNNFVITRYGNTTQGTFTPYGPNWSNYFNGSSNLAIAGTAIPATGTFTFEAWIYVATINTAGWLYTQRQSVSSSRFGFALTPDSVGCILDVSNGSNPSTTTTANAISYNTWTHVAVTRDGSNNLRIFISGVLNVTTAGYTYSIEQSQGRIGFLGNSATQYYVGYISNMRITNTALYTAAFTPSTAPLTAVSGTTLLTCQSNKFVDNSTNAYAVTTAGTPSVQRFSPFSPTSAYSTSVIGGSGYFDGSGDYLTLSSNASLGFGTGAYTVECWIYVTAAPAFSVFFAVSTGGLQFGLNSAGNIAIAEQNVDWRLESSTPPVLNAWNHVAATRDGSSATKLFLNGVQIASNTNTTNYLQGTTGNINLNPGNANKFTGYMTDLRVVKGTAIYTGAFTPPTAPVTAISGTSLLLDYTNAGILDNAIMNDLETVGAAQLSTSVKKYGSASMYFDGTSSSLSVFSNLQNLQFGIGDFTVECWVNKSANGVNSYDSVMGLGSTVNATQGWYLEVSTARGIFFIINNVSVSYGTWVNDGFWHHIAVTRSNGTVYIFKDGVLLTSGALSTAVPTTATAARIGNYYNGSTNFYFSGYIDDLRVTKGVARYTTSFTPPTSQVQDQ
jgi:hypothetical protein